MLTRQPLIAEKGYGKSLHQYYTLSASNLQVLNIEIWQILVFDNIFSLAFRA